MEQQNIPHGIIKKILLISKEVESQSVELNSHKQELLDVLSNMDKFSKILSKMKEWKIITKNEQSKVWETFRSHFVLSKTQYGENNLFQKYNKYMEENTELLKFITYYPLVVGARAVCEDDEENPILPDGLIQVQELGIGGVGLIRKVGFENWEEGIEKVFHLTRDRGKIVFDKEEYIKYGLIEHRCTMFDGPAYQSTYFQKEIAQDGKISFVERWAFNIRKYFDQDDIAIVWDGRGYAFLYKNKLADGTIELVKIGKTFDAPAINIEQWFGLRDNVINGKVGFRKVFFRKCYEQWQFVGIDGFKKLLFGEEKKIDELCRRK